MDEKLRAPLSLISQIASQVISTFKFGFLFWMGRECWPVPHFLASRIDSSKEDFNTILLRYIFVNLPNERSKLWAIETALRSKGASAVISEVSHLPFVTTKRLSLAASKGGGVGLFIRNVKEINLPTSACTRWSISPTLSSSPNPRFNLQLLKHRGASLGKNSWICELCEPDQIDTLNSKLNNSCNTTLSGGALTTTKAS